MNPVSPCSSCGMFFHKLPHCGSIRARMCRSSSKTSPEDIIGGPHKPIIPDSKDLFHLMIK